MRPYCNTWFKKKIWSYSKIHPTWNVGQKFLVRFESNHSSDAQRLHDLAPTCYQLVVGVVLSFDQCVDQKSDYSYFSQKKTSSPNRFFRLRDTVNLPMPIHQVLFLELYWKTSIPSLSWMIGIRRRNLISRWTWSNDKTLQGILKIILVHFI